MRLHISALSKLHFINTDYLIFKSMLGLLTIVSFSSVTSVASFNYFFGSEDASSSNKPDNLAGESASTSPSSATTTSDATPSGNEDEQIPLDFSAENLDFLKDGKFKNFMDALPASLFMEATALFPSIINHGKFKS